MPRKPRQTTLAPRGQVDGDAEYDLFHGVPIEVYTIQITGGCRISRETSNELLDRRILRVELDGQRATAVPRFKKRNAREDEAGDDDDKVEFVELQVTFHGKHVLVDGESVTVRAGEPPASTDEPTDPDDDEPS